MSVRKTYPRIDKLADAAQVLVSELEKYKRFVRDEAEYAYRDEVALNSRSYMARGWDEEAAREEAIDDIAASRMYEDDEYTTELKEMHDVLVTIKKWIP